MYKCIVKLVIIFIFSAFSLSACVKDQTSGVVSPPPSEENIKSTSLPSPPPAAENTDMPESLNDEIHFIVTGYQLFPPEEQILDDDFSMVYEKFTDAVYHKDLSAIDSFLYEYIELSFGGEIGKQDFYEIWDLHNAPEQSELWAELESIIGLGGVYYKETDCFVAPYTFTNFELDAYGYFVIIGKDVKVYEEENTGSRIIDYLSYNIIETNVCDNEYMDLSREFWDKTGQDFVKIKTLSETEGYIQKQYIRSPIDYRFGISRDDSGEWKLIFMLAGD